MKFPNLIVTLSVSLVTTFVQAHGYVDTVFVDGKAYPAWHPFTDSYTPGAQSITRKLPNDGPVTDINSPDLACNKGGEAGAALIADLSGGSVVSFIWNRWPDDHMGPVTTYMANCKGDCTKFNVGTSDAIWFKIDEASLDSKGIWASIALLNNNLTWSITIPPTIQPGQYVIRHEILALHSTGKPQFYPSCSQVNVKASSGTSVPSSAELAAIPGIYDDAGSKIYGDIWDPIPQTWGIAGPPVVSFAGRSGEAGTDF